MSKIQLFIMPFAGGSASAFQELKELLNDSIEVFVVEYPGRGSRIREPLCDTMDALISDVNRQIEEKRNKKLPFALMGYSMGVEVAFDLAQYVMEEKPTHMFFAAREAICYDTKGHDYALLNMEMFIEKIVALGGIDERILGNKRFLELYMRPIYADYKLLNEYIYKSEQGLLNTDVTVFYCEQDTPFSQVEAWGEFTTKKVEFFELGNNHFFVKHYAKEMAQIINDRLLRKAEKHGL